jgi:lincosamide and streptogramin A transport system ATP-binding/permease protein
MGFFSAGQKKKVLLAKSICEQHTFYIWDEPLNFIDLDSRKKIEELILKANPTMLLVEHDAVFPQPQPLQTGTIPLD